MLYVEHVGHESTWIVYWFLKESKKRQSPRMLREKKKYQSEKQNIIFTTNNSNTNLFYS